MSEPSLRRSRNGTPNVHSRSRPHQHFRAIGILALLGLFVGSGYLLTSARNATHVASAATIGNEPKASPPKGGPSPVRVTATRAWLGDIGVYVPGLGSVTPVYTISVKTRIDGEIMNVFYKEGETVRQGTPLAEIDPRPYQAQLEQYQGQLKHDQALLANARIDLARYAQEMKTNAVAEQTYATQQATVIGYEGQVQVDQGLIDATKLNIEYCHITAPISGLIGLRLVDPGNFVQAASGTTLLVITQMQPITVIFPIAENQLPAVRARRMAGRRLRVEVWSSDQQQRLATGTLGPIDNQIDQTTGTVRLRANFSNRDSRLFPNQFVNARLLLETRRGVVLIPTAATQLNGNNAFAFVVNADSTVSTRDIELGTTNGDVTQVTKGLKAGDVVVLSGVDKLTDGTLVAAKLEDVPAARGEKR
jgi:multidrug efflux system membrane fusion protein